MRDDRTKQKWTVEIEPFLLSRLPVTQDLYYEITNLSPSTFTGIDGQLKQLVQISTMKLCMVLLAFLEAVAGMMKKEGVFLLTVGAVILRHLKLMILDFELREICINLVSNRSIEDIYNAWNRLDL